MRPSEDATMQPRDCEEERAVVAYAMLIEPGLWTTEGRPRVDMSAVERLANSISAACRIMAYRNEHASDEVELRLLQEVYDSCDVSSLAIPSDVGPAEMNKLLGILITGGEIPMPVDSEERDPTMTVDEDACVEVVSTETCGMPDEVEPSEEPVDQQENEVDPDLDPEAGISHSGDDDEGQYMGGQE